MRPARGPAIVALAAALVALAPAVGSGQEGPSISELERLVREREASISRLEVRLRTLTARQDSLVAAKRRAQPGSAQHQTVSNQILENTERLKPVQRDLRILYENIRSLQTQLFQAYNAEITRTFERIETLKGQGRTTQNSPEMRRLVERQQQLVSARQGIATALEETQEDLYLPDLVYLPTDGPRDLRSKRAQALDAVALFDRRIGALEEDIRELARARDMREKANQLQRDLDLWGDDRGAGDRIEQMLDQSPGVTRGQENPFGETPEERLRRLQRRRLELIDRREEYRSKAELFADLLREFYR